MPYQRVSSAEIQQVLKLTAGVCRATFCAYYPVHRTVPPGLSRTGLVELTIHAGSEVRPCLALGHGLAHLPVVAQRASKVPPLDPAYL